MIENQLNVGLGGLKDLPDERDYKSDIIGGTSTDITLPPSYSLRHLQTPVKDQKSTNWCGAFAGCAILEYFQLLEFNKQLDLSETFLFKATKEFDKQDYKYIGTGAYMRSVCKAMQKVGTIEEQEGDFNGKDDRYKELNYSDIDYTMAKINCIDKFIQPIWNTEKEIKRLIYTQSPALCRIEISDTQIQQLRTDNHLKGEFGGYGHFVVITGWKEGYWEAKNSWGSKFNDGYIYIPFEWTKSLSFYFFTDNIMNKPFIDIDEKYIWAYPAITKLKEDGYLVGFHTENGQCLFNPNVPMTEGEKDNFIRLINILFRMSYGKK